MEWYYAVGGRHAGPVSDDELKALVDKGVVQGHTLLWREGLENWQTAKLAAPGLFPSVGAPSSYAAPQRPRAQEPAASQRPAEKTSRDEDLLDLDGYDAIQPSSEPGLRDESLPSDTPEYFDAPLALQPLDEEEEKEVARKPETVKPRGSSANPLASSVPAKPHEPTAAGLAELSAALAMAMCPTCGESFPRSQLVEVKGKFVCSKCRPRVEQEGQVYWREVAGKRRATSMPQKIGAGLLTLVTAVALVGMLLPSSMRMGVSSFQFRIVASTAFVLIAVVGGAHKFRYGQWIAAAMVLCWLGDYFLGTGRFIPGLLAFLLGHVALVMGFLRFGMDRDWFIFGLITALGIGGGVIFFLLPHVSAPERAPVIIYTIIISSMVGVAAGARGAEASLLVLVGAILFYISDFCVAAERYLDLEFKLRYVGLPLYYAAVVLLAWSVFDCPEDLERRRSASAK